METSGGAAFGFRITGSGEIRRTYQLLTSLRLNPMCFHALFSFEIQTSGKNDDIKMHI